MGSWVRKNIYSVKLCSCSTQLQDYEALNLSCSINNLTMFFRFESFAELPQALVSSFIQTITKLTTHFGQLAAKEETVMLTVFELTCFYTDIFDQSVILMCSLLCLWLLFLVELYHVPSVSGIRSRAYSWT